jgi:hypothetical protein
MMSRHDGIILGGTSERDVWTLDVNEEERKRVVEGHMRMFSEFNQGQQQVREVREVRQVREVRGVREVR